MRINDAKGFENRENAGSGGAGGTKAAAGGTRSDQASKNARQRWRSCRAPSRGRRRSSFEAAAPDFIDGRLLIVEDRLHGTADNDLVAVPDCGTAPRTPSWRRLGACRRPRVAFKSADVAQWSEVGDVAGATDRIEVCAVLASGLAS